MQNVLHQEKHVKEVGASTYDSNFQSQIKNLKLKNHGEASAVEYIGKALTRYQVHQKAL